MPVFCLDFPRLPLPPRISSRILGRTYKDLCISPCLFLRLLALAHPIVSDLMLLSNTSLSCRDLHMVGSSSWNVSTVHLANSCLSFKPTTNVSSLKPFLTWILNKVGPISLFPKALYILLLPMWHWIVIAMYVSPTATNPTGPSLRVMAVFCTSLYPLDLAKYLVHSWVIATTCFINY